MIFSAFVGTLPASSSLPSQLAPDFSSDLRHMPKHSNRIVLRVKPFQMFMQAVGFRNAVCYGWPGAPQSGGGGLMAKGQEKPGKNNKPKLSTKEKQDKKKEKQASKGK